jgi:hypothetical protein
MNSSRRLVDLARFSELNFSIHKTSTWVSDAARRSEFAYARFRDGWMVLPEGWQRGLCFSLSIP